MTLVLDVPCRSVSRADPEDPAITSILDVGIMNGLLIPWISWQGYTTVVVKVVVVAVVDVDEVVEEVVGGEAVVKVSVAVVT